MKRIWIVLLTGILLLGCLVGCSEQQEREADCIVGDMRICFVDEKDKRAWKEPLAKLLANELVLNEDGEKDAYQAPDPHAPAIPQCYACGLLDVTMDGVPELLVYPRGYAGSSGTATYFVYDIYSGQKLGEISGGNDQSLCVYYDMATGGLRLVGQYWLRGGWSWRGRYITRVEYEASIMECYEIGYLHTEHEIAANYSDVSDEDGYGIAIGEEYYPDTTYYLYRKRVTLDEYYAEHANFTGTYIRIPQTEMVVFFWSDVAEDDDSNLERGEKMAEALISSSQQFILPSS